MRNIIWLSFGFDLLFFDLLTKWIAKMHLSQPIVLWPGILEFSYHENPGIAFSIPVPNSVMMAAAPIIIAALAFYIVRSCNLKLAITKWVLILLAAGGLGNLINRFIFGAVIDFISFSFWPSFNLADAYLTIGTFLLLVFYGKITKESLKNRFS